MIKINLLPFRKAKRLENIRMQISVFGLCVFLVALVLVFTYLNINGKLKEVQAKNARLNTELKSYAGMLKKIEDLKKKRADLQGKLEVIRGLEAQKAGPVQLFDEICMAVPEGKVFLKAMGESGDKVTMSGVALDYDTVAQFMTNLENTKTIDSVTLGGTTQSILEDQSVCSFSLVCLKHSEKKVTPKHKGKKSKKGKKNRKKR